MPPRPPDRSPRPAPPAGSAIARCTGARRCSARCPRPRAVGRAPSRGFQRHLLAQGAAVGVGVHRDHPVAPDRGQRRTERRGDGGLADPALEAEHRDLIAPLQRMVDVRDEVAAVGVLGAFTHVDGLARKHVEQPAPAAGGGRFDGPEQRAGGQIRIRRLRHFRPVRRRQDRSGRVGAGRRGRPRRGRRPHGSRCTRIVADDRESGRRCRIVPFRRRGRRTEALLVAESRGCRIAALQIGVGRFGRRMPRRLVGGRRVRQPGGRVVVFSAVTSIRAVRRLVRQWPIPLVDVWCVHLIAGNSAVAPRKSPADTGAVSRRRRRNAGRR